jgi:glycerophosphoryl diester phosphodiesterase
VVGFSLLCRILALVAVAPLSAVILGLFLARWGRYSVGNFEIVEFLLSAPGLLSLVTVGSLNLAALLLEQAGLVFLLEDRGLSFRGAVFRLLGVLPRVLGLAARKLVRYLLIALPFLAATLLTVSLLWSGRDLNGLVVLKPPVFWLGAAVAGALLLACGVVLVRYMLTWALALPILLLEPGTSPRQALRTSALRTRGNLRRVAVPILALAAGAGAISLGVAAGLRFASAAVLDRVGMSMATILPVTAGLLLIHGAAAILLSAITSSALVGLVLELHGDSGGTRPDMCAASVLRPACRFRALAWSILGTVVVVSAAVTWIALEGARPAERVEITAHRAGAAAAPENTLAALRTAMEHGADWVEIDVQRTADGAIIVLHDGDLARLGRPDLRVAGASLAEIRAVDIGAALDPRFAGEGVPTLDEFLAAAGGRVRLNIELKPAGREDVGPLVRSVVEALKRAGQADGTRICSQSYEGIRLAKETEPRVQIGFIAGAAIGDLSRLDIDFLMVNAGLVTRKLIRQAAARKIEVHAWTVNDPDRLPPLVDRGVANIITDDVAAMRTRLEEVRNLDPAMRLLLRTRNWFVE